MNRALLRDSRGAVALEMALVTSVLLVPLLSMLAGTGQALLTQTRLSRALHAGLIQAWGSPSTVTASSIQSAATAGFQASATASSGYGSSTVTPTATFSYYCIDPTVGTHSGAAVASNATCPSGQVLGTYVTLALSSTIQTIFAGWAGTPAWTLTVNGTVRIS